MKRNKGWRNHIQFLKFRKRLRREANYIYAEPRRNNKFRKQGRITTMDLYRDNAFIGYRTTSTPCSCPMCSGEHYKRHQQKQETKKLIDENFNQTID